MQKLLHQKCKTLAYNFIGEKQSKIVVAMAKMHVEVNNMSECQNVRDDAVYYIASSAAFLSN